MRRLVSILAIVLLLSATAATPVLAGKPEHFPTEIGPLDVVGICPFTVHLDNTTVRSLDTLFDPAPDGSVRYLSRGFLDGSATNLSTGESVRSRGGGQLTLRFAADGSVSVRLVGTTTFAFYLPGDDVNVEPGLYMVDGSVSEWYAPDGHFIRAVVRGHLVDVCALLAEP